MFSISDANVFGILWNKNNIQGLGVLHEYSSVTDDQGVVRLV